MRRIILLLLLFVAVLEALPQSELNAPFNISVKCNKADENEQKTVEVTIRNLSLNTYFISENSTPIWTQGDSLMLFELNYSVRFGRYLDTYDFTLDFSTLKPFGKLTFTKIISTQTTSYVMVDFDFVSKKVIKKANLGEVSNGKYRIQLYEFVPNCSFGHPLMRHIRYKVLTEPIE